jgi:Predicted membrane protein (DUF2157)
MPLSIFENLYNRGIISSPSIEKLREFYAHPRVRVHLELRTLLFMGVLMIGSGVGILVYNHMNSIGHLVIVLAIITTTLGCYGYCFFHNRVFSPAEVKSPSILFDYILLLGSTLLLILFGYLQFQFNVFGNRLGLATFIPMCFLFATAYFFDHKGVLSLAITNLAAWLGISTNRKSFYGLSSLESESTIYAAVALGIFLIVLSLLVKQKTIKQHFHPLYHQFGTHIGFIAIIAGIIHFDRIYFLWLVALVATWYYHLKKALQETSFYYMVISCLYCYIGISYVVKARLFNGIHGDLELYAILFYFLFSGIGMALLLISLNKKLKANAGI